MRAWRNKRGETIIEVSVAMVIVLMILIAFMGFEKMGNNFNLDAESLAKKNYSTMIESSGNLQVQIISSSGSSEIKSELDVTVYQNSAGLFFYR